MRRPLVIPSLVGALLLASGGALRAQADSARAGGPAQVADSLVRLAHAVASTGDTARALDLLKHATRVAPRYAPAFYERGVLLSRASRLGLADVLTRRAAGQQLERALDLDRDNPRYLMELGRLRLKTPFLRLEAERLFNRALRAAERRNSPHDLAEVHWELGQIHERRYITMANRHMITNGVAFSPDAALGDWRYTRDFLAQSTQPIEGAGELDFRQAESHYRAAIAADPSHEGAVVGLLALLADADRLEEMVRVARDARRTLPDSPRILMALGLALHRELRETEAQAVFDSALVRYDSATRADMTGLQTVLRKEEAKAYASLSGPARMAADSMYWDVADPLRLTGVNEARTEFLSRVAYSDLRFTSAEFAQKGWRTDRGLVYIRYGPPPKIATFAPEGMEIEGSDAIALVTTVWWYPQSSLRFVFHGPPAMNYASFASDFRAYAENARYLEPVRFDNLGPLLKVDSVAVQVARFRADSGRGVDLSIFADVPTRRMLRDVDIAQATLETALFISDGRRRTLVAAHDSSVVRADQRDSLTTRAWRRTIPAGEYVYRIEARQAASARAARGLARLDAAAFPAGTLSVSDILVARRLVPKTPAPRTRGDFLMVPNASLTFAKHDTAFLYWENYGVARDSTGSGRLRIELALHLTAIERDKSPVIRAIGGLADAVGLTAEGDDRVVLRFDRVVPLDSSDRVANYLALDLGDAPYGLYSLELKVTDLTTGRSVAQQRNVTVPRP